MHSLSGKIILGDPIAKNHQQKHDKGVKTFIMAINQQELTKYYAWFLKKHYNVDLVHPQRGAHITFCSDVMPQPKFNSMVSELVGLTIYATARPDIVGCNQRTGHWWIGAESDDLDNIRYDFGIKFPTRLHITLGSVIPTPANKMASLWAEQYIFNK